MIARAVHRWGTLLLALASCRNAARPTATKSPRDPRLSRAQELRVLITRPDYRGPEVDVHWKQEQDLVRLLWDACADASVDACVQLDHKVQDTKHELRVLHAAAVLVADRCLDRDISSCDLLRRYRRFATTMVLTEAATSRYLDACRAGEASACGIASEANRCAATFDKTPRCRELKAAAPKPELTQAMVARFCERGLAIACGALGDLNQRNGYALDNRVGYAYLARGCDLGDSFACESAIDLARDVGKDADVPSLTARADELNRKTCHEVNSWSACLEPRDANYDHALMIDCEEGELLACARSETRQGEREACLQYGYRCERWYALASDSPTEQQQALEQGCQWQDLDLCRQLVSAYRAGTYPEPIPSRAAQIERWLATSPPARPKQ